MLSPAQAKKHSNNLRDLFLEEQKPIVKLRVLALNDHAVSWVQDSKNCARIYTRMLQSRAVCPRILPLLSSWASLLLEYAPDYGFGDANIFLVKRRPTMFQSNEWLRRLLIEVRDMDSVEKIYGRMVEKFYWDEKNPGCVLAVKHPTCAITHRPMRNFEYGVEWITRLSGYREIISEPTDIKVFTWLEKLIKQGLKRHRREGYRANLSKKIRMRNKRNG